MLGHFEISLFGVKEQLMNLSKHFIRVVVFSVCALFLGAAAHGHYRASIMGVVTDPRGDG